MSEVGWSRGPPVAWDEQLAARLVGRCLLLGITRLSADGELVDRSQIFGIVKSADARRGIEIALEGSRAGETYTLPPDTGGISVAEAGEYRLRSTGEVVIDPDFTGAWIITNPAVDR